MEKPTMEISNVAVKDRIGVSRFEVSLDDKQNIYYCGKIVTGRVFIVLNSTTEITSIKVICKGEGQVKFTNRSAGFKRKFSSEEVYLHEEIELLDTEAKIQSDDFSFKLQLPEKLPSSFEGRYGRVRYSICASLNTNENIKIYSDTLSFTVAPIFDLNNHPLAPLPISENSAKTFMGHTEPLTVSIFLPVRGYVPGQTIPLKVNFENSSNIDVKKLRVVLKKVVLYRSMENVRKHKEIVVEIEQPIDNKNNCVYNSEFDVPPIPPSGTICNLIDVEYKLKVEAFADINEWYYKMFYKNLKIRMDIIIGTVPLRNYQDPVDSNENLKSIEESTSEDQIDGDENHLAPCRLKYQRSRIYRSSKPEQDETDEEKDKEIQEFSPMYRVYEFKNNLDVKVT